MPASSGGVGADAEPQRGNCSDGVGGTFAQHAKGVPQIVNQGHDPSEVLDWTFRDRIR